MTIKKTKMKKLFLLIFTMISLNSFSQSVEKAINDLIDVKLNLSGIDQKIETKVNALVNSLVDARIDAKLAAFSKTLDSSIILERTATGTFNIDTIRQANNTNKWYFVTLTGDANGTKISAVRMVNIAVNSSGAYTVQKQSAIVPFSGISGTFDVSIVNNVCTLKITLASASTTVKWNYRKTNI